jgi:hypothetical protein
MLPSDFPTKILNSSCLSPDRISFQLPFYHQILKLLAMHITPFPFSLIYHEHFNPNCGLAVHITLVKL